MTTAKEKEIIRLSKISTFITYHTKNFMEIETKRYSATYRTAFKVRDKLNLYFDAVTWGEIEAWNSGSLKK